MFGTAHGSGQGSSSHARDESGALVEAQYELATTVSVPSTSHVTVLVCVPLPHVTEQSDQLPVCQLQSGVEHASEDVGLVSPLQLDSACASVLPSSRHSTMRVREPVSPQMSALHSE